LTVLTIPVNADTEEPDQRQSPSPPDQSLPEKWHSEQCVNNNGHKEKTTQGVPQGSPLSPLLSNIVLNELDRELEKRGHTFVRYADDCQIYVSSQRAGERGKAEYQSFY